MTMEARPLSGVWERQSGPPLNDVRSAHEIAVLRAINGALAGAEGITSMTICYRKRQGGEQFGKWGWPRMTPAELASLAVPVDAAGVPADTCILLDGSEWTCAWFEDGGKRKTPFHRTGPGAKGFRAAYALCRALRERSLRAVMEAV